jgi:predicted nucleic acid-binding protein
VKFFAPTVAYEDAWKYSPALLAKRGVPGETAMAVLEGLVSIVQSVDEEIYADMRTQAMQRIAMRDANDWPILACAMTLGWPVWTEDADFFGTGVPIWTTDRVSLYFD